MKKQPLFCCVGVAVSSSRIVTKAGMLSLQPHNLSAHEVCRGTAAAERFTSLSPLCRAAPHGRTVVLLYAGRVCGVQVAHITRVLSLCLS